MKTNRVLGLLLLFTLLLSTTAFAYTNSTISATGNTIDLSSGSASPRGYTTDNGSNHYILTTASSIDRYDSDFNFVKLVGASSGWTMIGMDYNDLDSRFEFFIHTSASNIRLGYDNGANIVTKNTVTLDDFTPIAYHFADLRDIENDVVDNQLYALDRGDSRINVYDYDFTGVPSNNLNPSFNRVILIPSEIDVSTIYRMYYLDDYIYLLDDANNVIWKIDKLGGLQERLYYPTMNNNQKDIFKYNNTWWTLDSDSPYLAREYNYSEPVPDNTTTTVGGVTYDLTSQCIDYQGDGITELCTDANVTVDSFGNVQITCNDLGSISACNLGCSVVNESNTISGDCQNTVPNNECGFVGFTKCQTLESYATCQDGNGDGVLAYENILSCPLDYYCVDDELGASCIQNNLTQTDWTQDYVNVNLEITSTNAYEENTVVIDSVSSSLGTSASLVLGQGFVPIGQYLAKTVAEKLTTEIKVEKVKSTGTAVPYSAFSCDFEKEILVQDFDVRNINSTQNFEGTLPNGDYNLEVEYILEDFTEGEHLVTFKDGGSNLAIISYTYNATEKRLVVSDYSTGRVVYNQTSLQPTEDLKRVYAKIIFNKEIKQYTISLNVIRIPLSQDVVERKYSLPISYINNNLGVPDEEIFNSTGSYDVVEVTVTKTGNYPTFQYKSITEEDVKVCTYIDTGCRNVLVWGNEKIGNIIPPTYHFYETIESCAVQIGGTISKEAQDKLDDVDTGERDYLERAINKDLTKTQKVFIALFVSVALFIVFVALYIETQDKSLLVIGSLVCGLSIFSFTLASYIEPYIIVIFMIIGIGVIAKGVRGNN